MEPVTLSSPEAEVFALDEGFPAEEVEEEEVFQPASQLYFLIQELKAQKAQQQQDHEKVEQMFLSLQTAMQSAGRPTSFTTHGLSAMVTRGDYSSPLTHLPQTSPAQRVIDWTGYTPSLITAPDRSPAQSLAGDSVMLDSMLAQVSVDDIP